MTAEFTPTTAEDYPIVPTLELELPSGAKVRVRRPSVYTMMRTGQFPADVKDIIMRTAQGETPTDEDRFTALDFLVSASFVSPKVSWTPRKGCLVISDISDDDRVAVVMALGLQV